MCTKTKTSFGCGHCVKTTEDCGIPNCQTLEKWKIPKPMDCAKCRASGEAETRGKDGRGRHGKARHQESRQSSSDTLPRVTQSPGTAAHMAISPWAPKTPEIPKEKPWNTPTRQKADEAWLVEHERRMSDLDEKTTKLSLRSNRQSSRRASPRASYERGIEITEIVDDPEDMDVSPSKTKPIRLLPYEIEEVVKTPSRPRNRKVSHDSEGSMPHYQESPLMKTTRRKTQPVPPISEHDPLEYHNMHRRSRPHGSKTEPYYPQSCCFESPLSGSPITNGDWTYQYHGGQPLRRDPYYPPAYPVY